MSIGNLFMEFELILSKVKEEDTNEMPKNVAENQRPDRKCEDIIKIKLEKDFFADPPSNYIDQIQDEVAQPIAKKNNDETFKVLNQSSPTINRVENFGLQMGYKDNCDLIIRDKENIPIFLRSEVGLNIGVHTSMHSFEKPFVCKVCGKFFTQRGNLNRHTRTHTGEKPFECGVCGKVFTQQPNLDIHTRIHTGEKPFVCEVCDKTFTCKSSLDKNTRTHTGEKPFKCRVCGKVFTQRSNLDVHTRTHTGEKPFECEVCGKTFTRKNRLITHTRTHTGEKPFKCGVCDKAFAEKFDLNKHKRTHILVKNHEVCGKLFTQKHTGDL